MRADQSHRIPSYQLDRLVEKIYIKTSVERCIILPVPFVLIFYLVYTYYITPIQSNWSCKNYANNINHNSFKFFDELACRPKCRSMRECSAFS